MNQAVIDELDNWECAVFRREPDFCKTFCPYAEDVLATSWSSTHMYFTWLSESGASILDNAAIENWLEFYERKESEDKWKVGG